MKPPYEWLNAREYPKRIQRVVSTMIPPNTWEMMDRVFLVRSMPDSKNASAGIMVKTKTDDSSTQVVSPGEITQSDIFWRDAPLRTPFYAPCRGRYREKYRNHAGNSGARS
jgi:hypothetical protein